MVSYLVLGGLRLEEVEVELVEVLHGVQVLEIAQSVQVQGSLLVTNLLIYLMDFKNNHNFSTELILFHHHIKHFSSS